MESGEPRDFHEAVYERALILSAPPQVVHVALKTVV